MRGAQPWKTNRSRALRSRETSAEARLWGRLRNRQLGGLKFVRQHSIGPYFVDFLCREHNVVVEIDGATHSAIEQMERDAARSHYLKTEGYRVFRAFNGNIYENVDGVLDGLLAFIQQSK